MDELKYKDGKLNLGNKVDIDGNLSVRGAIDQDGYLTELVDNPEGGLEVETDKDDRIIAYRKEDGTKVENVGIKTKHIECDELTFESYEEKKHFVDYLGIKENVKIKDYHLPKYGTVNIKEETFYLTSGDWSSYEDDVVLIQMYDDNSENAQHRLTLSYYYIKSTLTPIVGGGYDRNSVNENSVRLDFFPGKEVGETFGIGTDSKTYYTDEVTKVNNIYYVTSTLVDGEVVPESIQVTESQDKEYYVRKLQQVDGIWYLKSTLEGGATQQVDYKNETINGKAVIKVNRVTDVPPYKAWCVNKNPEHYCVVDFNFGYYYTKNNVPVGVKYQGSSTTAMRKRNFRFTFYKNNSYSKKNKIKIGELLRLSGFNLKANFSDPIRFKEHTMFRVLMAVWENRERYNSYPWDSDKQPYTGATGMINGFPVRIDIGGEFYGVSVFSLKKDEKNYMLDDDNSGIFVSNSSGWGIDSWEDEMNDEMSESTRQALINFVDFITSEQYTKENIPEHMHVVDWIDYFICMQVFYMLDNAARNVILFSQEDKKLFYPFFYDLDLSWLFMSDEEVTYDIITENRWHSDLTIPWGKFKDEYWDEIVNRYCELRNTILNCGYIQAVYDDIVRAVPKADFDRDINKWGSFYSPISFEKMMEQLNTRLEWLDTNYFKV